MGSQQSLGFKSCLSLGKVLHFFLVSYGVGCYTLSSLSTWGSPVKDTNRGGKSLPHYFTDRKGCLIGPTLHFLLRSGSFKLDTQI